MARNYIQPGNVLPLTAPSGGVTSGLCYLIGTLVVVAQDTQAVGVTFQGKVTGVFTLPKATGQTWAEGAKLYWDNTAKNFTTTSTSNTLAGVAVAAALSGDTTGSVRLDGVTR
jgi:predicted RecA/RadA family phage recombinase